jgi:C-terminal processing protease CtpA/Prc
MEEAKLEAERLRRETAKLKTQSEEYNAQLQAEREKALENARKEAKEIIEDLIKYNYVPDRPMLGITYYPVSASQQYSMIAQIKGLPAGTLIINEISADSSLANTTARQYDMIIAVDGQPLTTADVLLEKIDNGKVGDTFTLTLCRVNSNYTIEEFKVEAKLVEDKGGSEPITTTVQYLDPFEYFNQFGFGY